MMNDIKNSFLFVLAGFCLVATPVVQADPIVDIHGDSVDVWLLNWEDNCAFKTIGGVTQVADTFFIVWSDTSSVAATCMCYFDLKTTLMNLEPGTYWAKTYVATMMTNSFPNLDTVFTGDIQFSVEGNALRDSLEAESWQSACHAFQSINPDFTPSTYALDISSYPNPFNAETTFKIALEHPAQINLTIYNVAGYQIEQLSERNLPAGVSRISWRPANLPSGVYYVRASLPEFPREYAVNKLVIVK